MKKKIFGLLIVSLLSLTGCDEHSSTSSSSVSTSISQSELLKQIENNILNTKFNGYSFKDKTKKITNASVKFYKNEVFLTGHAEFEEEGDVDFVTYKALFANKYYDIDSYSGKHARIKDIVEGTVTYEESSYKITLSEAKKDFDSVIYTKDWFVGDLMPFFDDENKPTAVVKEANNKQNVSLNAYGGGTKTMNAELTFDENKNLLGGSINITEWGKDNFDTETLQPFDKDQEPVSSSKKEATLLLGEITGNDSDVSIDLTPYFVSSIDDFSVRGYSDGLKDGTANVGDSIDVNVNSFSPKTALNAGDIKVLSSDNEEIIKLEESINSFKALKPGTANITVGIKNTDVSATKQITVLTPTLKTIWLSAKTKTIDTGSTFKATLELMPAEVISSYTKDDFNVIVSGDNEAIRFDGFNDNLTELNFTALKATKENVPAKVNVELKDGSKKSNSISFIVKDPIVEQDKTWLVGTWKANTTITNSYNEKVVYESTFKFFNDNSGTIVQKVTDVAVDNEASFTYVYDGESIIIKTWTGDDYNTIKKPTSIVISSDKSTIIVVLLSEDVNGDYNQITIELKKDVDLSWLVGTWNASEDDDMPATTLTFNLDFTGTAKFAAYGGNIAFTYTYDGTNLTLKLNSSIYSYKKTVSVSKTKLVIQFKDDEASFTSNLTKAN